MRSGTALVVRDVRLGGRDLVHYNVIVSPFDGSFDLRSLVARTDDEAVVLRAHVFVDVEWDAHTLSAAAFLAALAHELDRSVRRPCLCVLAEFRDPLVYLAEERLVLCLAGKAVLKPHTGLVPQPGSSPASRAALPLLKPG